MKPEGGGGWGTIIVFAGILIFVFCGTMFFLLHTKDWIKLVTYDLDLLHMVKSIYSN